MDRLALKWGSLKDWSGVSRDNGPAQDAITRWLDRGTSMSLMAQKNSPEQIQDMCDVIDALSDPCDIYNDFTGEDYTKEQAKEYVRNYNADR